MLTILISEETCIIFFTAKWFEIEPDGLRLKQRAFISVRQMLTNVWN